MERWFLYTRSKALTLRKCSVRLISVISRDLFLLIEDRVPILKGKIFLVWVRLEKNLGRKVGFIRGPEP